MNNKQKQDQLAKCRNVMRGFDSVCRAHSLSNSERFSSAGAFLSETIKSSGINDKLALRLTLLDMLPALLFDDKEFFSR